MLVWYGVLRTCVIVQTLQRTQRAQPHAYHTLYVTLYTPTRYTLHAYTHYTCYNTPIYTLTLTRYNTQLQDTYLQEEPLVRPPRTQMVHVLL